MDRLWDESGPVTVRQIHTELLARRQLAYNTVLTVVDNLYKKGWLTREPAGRAHLYRPTVTRDEYTARLMRDTLADSGDARAALLRFVGQMSPQETEALRDALAAHENTAGPS